MANRVEVEVTNFPAYIDQAVDRIADQLWSANVRDSNGEPANVVDSLNRIASGLFAVSNAIEKREACQCQK